MKNLLLLLLISVIALISCSRKSVEVNKAVITKDILLQADVDTQKFKRESYEFKSYNLRDPFIPVQSFVQNIDYEVQTTQASVDYRLGGLIWDEYNPVALIYTSNNKKWIAIKDKIVYPVLTDNYNIKICEDRVVLITPEGKIFELRIKSL
ncbi:MAG: hypothetical protein AB1765_05085 [Candidatus Hydrogenedentota bacterium]